MRRFAQAATLSTLAAALLLPSAASAKQICGWYSILYCSTSENAVHAANKGWGAVINTNHFRGFAPGKYCLVSGPQGRASALRDRADAIRQGYASSGYVKRACADEYYTGD